MRWKPGKRCAKRSCWRSPKNWAAAFTPPARVLGIDDWGLAQRPDIRHGAGRSRSAPRDRTLARPLCTDPYKMRQARPEAEVISRDRADTYAQAAGQGAPQATH